MKLTDLVNEATLVRYQEEYDALLALAKYDDWAADKTYIQLSNTNLFKIRETMKQLELSEWLQQGLDNGTLQFETPTSPDAALNGGPIVAAK